MASSKFAVIKTGGKQYKVKEGDKVRVEKLLVNPGDFIKLSEVLLKAEGGEIEIGAPFVKSAAVEAEVLSQGRDDKKIIFRYHSKTRYRKLKGHRQPFTELKITSIH
jgi:large subunit ribosomal protein L21